MKTKNTILHAEQDSNMVVRVTRGWFATGGTPGYGND